MCWGLNGSRTRLPVKFLTEFSCRPGSRYSPLPLAKLVQRCAFLVLTQAKQFACLLRANKNPSYVLGSKWLALKDSNLQPTG